MLWVRWLLPQLGMYTVLMKTPTSRHSLGVSQAGACMYGARLQADAPCAQVLTQLPLVRVLRTNTKMAHTPHS